MNSKTRIAVCGAGIAGLATAYFVSEYFKECTVYLVDKNQPMSLTTSKSGENFRDYWPHPSMRWLSRRSISLMKKLQTHPLNDGFSLNFSGYHFVSGNRSQSIFQNEGDEDFARSNEILTDTQKIEEKFPYLDKSIEKSILIKNAGDFSVHNLGHLLLRLSRNLGLRYIQREIVQLEKEASKIKILLAGKEELEVDKIILCPGPFLNQLAQDFGLFFPIENHLQRKFIIPDIEDIVSADMPFTIFADSQYLKWTEDEFYWIQSEGLNELELEFPGGLHIKPEGRHHIKLGWAFNRTNEEPTWKNDVSDLFIQIVLRGATRIIPALIRYVDEIPAPCIQYSGYYTRTKENWPFIGPTGVEDVYVVGALSGFGTMMACSAGELCARYVCGMEIPAMAQYFTFDRYANPNIQTEIKGAISDGQL